MPRFLLSSFPLPRAIVCVCVCVCQVGQSVVNMNNYGDAFLALLQVSVDNNWQDIMWANSIESEHMSNAERFFVGVYFITFFVAMGWFGINILTALIIETYDIAKAKIASAPSTVNRGTNSARNSARNSKVHCGRSSLSLASGAEEHATLSAIAPLFVC